MTLRNPTAWAGRTVCRLLPIAAIVVFAPAGAAAQDGGGGAQTPASAGVHSSITWHSTYEDNVYRSADNPTAAMATTLSATAGADGRLRRLGASANGSASWVHYDRLQTESGADLGGSLRVSGLFYRVQPYLAGSYLTSRRRQNAEIDTRPRRVNSTVAAGGIVQLGGKTTADLSAGRSFEAYERSASFDGVNLASALNRGSDRFTLSVRQELTPLTRISVTGELRRDRFDVSSRRNGEFAYLTAGFQSDGFFHGDARVGLRILKPSDPALPESRGLFAAVGTSFSVRERLRVSLDAQRDVAPSYRPDSAYYQFYGIGGSLSYAIFRSLELSALVDRRFADYQFLEPVSRSLAHPDVEDALTYGGGVAYRLGDAVTMDLTGRYTKRLSQEASRRYHGLSMSAGIDYAFQ
jgi:hypothetical protein